MKVRLRAETTLGGAIETLEQVLTRTQNFRDSGSLAMSSPYAELCTDNLRLLRNVLSLESARSLVVTPSYFAAATAAPGTAHSMIHADVEHFILTLRTAIDELEQHRARWSNGDVFVVPDTNVFLHHALQFDEIDWHAELAPRVADFRNVRLVVPMVVVDELDRLKRAEDKTRARESLAILESYIANPSRPAGLTTTTQTHGWVTVEVLVDDLDHVRLPDNDNEIVDQAAVLKQVTGREVIVVTGDTGMVLRAKAARLEVVRLTYLPPPPRHGKQQRGIVQSKDPA